MQTRAIAHNDRIESGNISESMDAFMNNLHSKSFLSYHSKAPLHRIVSQP